MILRSQPFNHKYALSCPVCFTAYPPADNVLSCKTCSAPTVVALNLDRLRTDASPRIGLGDKALSSSMWKYFDYLPLEDPHWITSQGEGGTPLTAAPRLATRLGTGALFIKNETVNPTGSFKDRQISVSISKAREAGAQTIAVVSSGNVAAAAASYSALAGINCNIFAPRNAPEEKLVQARMYGAVFYKVNTLSSSRIFELVTHLCAQKNWHLLSTAGLYNPYQVEGAKTIAYELHDQFPTLPDWIFAPVGGGGLLGALWRGFSELKALGVCERIPRLVGVQASACTPLIQAIERKLSPADVVANPVAVGDTVAGAIADDVLFDAYTALPAIRQTQGLAVAVSDQQMLEAEKLLAETTGVFTEPASAATVAALRDCIDSGLVRSTDSVCCIITGSGFKDMASARKLVNEPVLLESTEEAFSKVV